MLWFGSRGDLLKHVKSSPICTVNLILVHPLLSWTQQETCNDNQYQAEKRNRQKCLHDAYSGVSSKFSFGPQRKLLAPANAGDLHRVAHFGEHAVTVDLDTFTIVSAHLAAGQVDDASEYLPLELISNWLFPSFISFDPHSPMPLRYKQATQDPYLSDESL